MRSIRPIPRLVPRHVLPVLLDARALLLRDGWHRGEYLTDACGGPRRAEPGEPWTLVGALNASEPNLARWHARQLLERLCPDHNLVRWNTHGAHNGRHVVELLDSAVRYLGAVPPRTRYRERRRRGGRRHGGGWTISLQPSQGDARTLAGPAGSPAASLRRCERSDAARGAGFSRAIGSPAMTATAAATKAAPPPLPTAEDLAGLELRIHQVRVEATRMFEAAQAAGAGGMNLRVGLVELVGDLEQAVHAANMCRIRAHADAADAKAVR